MTLPLYGLMVPSGSVKLCLIYFPISEGIDSGVADSEEHLIWTSLVLEISKVHNQLTRM